MAQAGGASAAGLKNGKHGEGENGVRNHFPFPGTIFYSHGYVYDLENRVICVLGTDGTCTSPTAMLYFYDPQGDRVGKQQGDTLEDHVYDPQGHIISVHDGSTNLLRAELYAGGRHVATWNPNANYGPLFWNHADWLGTHRVRSDSTGTAREWCTDTPYGMNLNCVGQSDSSPMHFTGKQHDWESNLDYFGARYFGGGNALGRFMSPDPLPWIHWQHGDEDDQKKFAAYIANPQTLNMYAYVNNNPLSKTDPTGMNACGTNNDSTCEVTVTIRDRSKDANGNYNDQFTGVKNQQNYNATAVVTVNGKETGTYLVKTTPSDPNSSATIANGTYSATLTTHGNDVAIRLQPTNAIPTIGPNPSRSDGQSIAQGILVHSAGVGNFTGVGRDGRAVSQGCQVVCTSQYPDFKRATGVDPIAGPPQQHFTVDIYTQENMPQ